MRGSVVITDFRIELRSTVAKVNGYTDASIHATGVRSYGAEHLICGNEGRPEVTPPRIENSHNHGRWLSEFDSTTVVSTSNGAVSREPSDFFEVPERIQGNGMHVGIAIRNIQRTEHGSAHTQTRVHVFQRNPKRVGKIVSASDREMSTRGKATADVSNCRRDTAADIEIPSVFGRGAE
jgi:hypothetical protein